MNDDRELRAAGPLLVAAGLVVTASVVYTANAAATSSPDVVRELLPISIACAVFIAFGELLRITLPGGRQTAPLAAAGSIAFALAPAARLAWDVVPFLTPWRASVCRRRLDKALFLRILP